MCLFSNYFNITPAISNRSRYKWIQSTTVYYIIPIKITVGKKVVDDKVELKLRNQGYSEDVLVEDIISKVKELVK